MAIPGIGAAASAASAAAQAVTKVPSLPTVAGPASPSEAPAGFGEMIGNAIDNLNGMHHVADTLAVQAATGDLDDVHEYTIAATQAQLATQLTVAVRDRAVTAFTEIMRMPI